VAYLRPITSHQNLPIYKTRPHHVCTHSLLKPNPCPLNHYSRQSHFTHVFVRCLRSSKHKSISVRLALMINPKDSTIAYTYKSESVTRKQGGGGACEKDLWQGSFPPAPVSMLPRHGFDRTTIEQNSSPYYFPYPTIPFSRENSREYRTRTKAFGRSDKTPAFLVQVVRCARQHTLPRQSLFSCEFSPTPWQLHHEILSCRRGCRKSSHVSPGELQRAHCRSFFPIELSSLWLLSFFPRRGCRKSRRVSPGALQRAPCRSFFPNELSSLRLLSFFPNELSSLRLLRRRPSGCRRSTYVSLGMGDNDGRFRSRLGRGLENMRFRAASVYSENHVPSGRGRATRCLSCWGRRKDS